MNNYLFIYGIKVSGYFQYSGFEILQGFTVDNAYNTAHLDNPHGTSVVVLEAHELKSRGDYAMIGDNHISKGRRLV